MRDWRWLVLVMVACGSSDPPARSPQQRTLDSAPAVAALRESRFADAAREATSELAIDPRSSVPAAIRAIAAYQQAATHLVDELGSVMEQAEGLHYFDHEKGRAIWKATLDQLDAIDRDLATASTDPNFSLELCLACWKFDWNHNGRIDDRDDKLFELEFDGHGGSLAADDPRRRPTFRFDVGDLDWARAMIAFQRAGIELVLAYRWSELDKLFLRDDGDRRVVIHLVDADRVKHAHALIEQALGFADRCRAEYQAETDDDREWVPNPRQKSHAIPLEVDDALYQRWTEITADVRRLLGSEEGISLREVAAMGDKKLGRLAPNAYIDLGRMLRQPTDIVIDLREDSETPEVVERVLRGLLGHGYTTEMRASPLVARLRHMNDEVDHGEDTFERKLRYLFWLN